jgi:hypothetical protein
MVTKLWIKILKSNHFSLRNSGEIAITPQLNSTGTHTITHAHKNVELNLFSLRKSGVMALTPQLNSTEAHTHISRIVRQMPHFSILTLKPKLRFLLTHYCVNKTILKVHKIANFFGFDFEICTFS